jgi:hypothetical protein
MKCRLTIAAACLALSFNVLAGPKEDAQSVFDKFLAEFTAASVDGVVGLFTPDALFWGTTMRDLAITPEAVRQYFAPMSNFKPNQRKATPVAPASAVVLSDNAVALSGMWQIEQVVNGMPTVGAPLRISMIVVKRGDRWLIAQFHNSVRPNPPAQQ